jgi:hypothetical protein
MGDIKTYKISKEAVIRVETPNSTRSWKPVGHSELIDSTLESIHLAGFTLDKEDYSMARKGNVVNGRYTISNIADPEMQIQIGWQNSIDKSLSLKYAIGVKIFICSNGCVSGDMGAFKRKHTGDIQEYTPRYITEYIKTAGDVFTQMQKEREEMKQIEVSRNIQAHLLGELYLEHNIIQSTQLNIIKRELESPTFDYGAPNSLWELYQFTTFALRDTHPTLWMDSHIDSHKFFTDQTGIIIPSIKIEPTSPFVQLNLLD